MKVKELIEQLQKLDPNLDVYATCEDPGILGENQLVRPFDIVEASAVEVELSRDESRRPQISTVVAGEGRKRAIIEITADF
ncbi:hypothetical protein [Pseudomonas capsici]|uniref:hypothetical protein n=1 Tax=Pseudomonas capsici TaxID=2810614 RepID=UPI0021F11CEE|nr:hypothetical protein [Pseudomonas capsici]MCV4285109.1 hypothetical protein [Pseudomonas capsici]